MSRGNEKLIGPFTLEAKVYFTNDDGTVVGNAVVGLPVGRLADEAAILRAIGQTIEALPDDCVLLGGSDFFNKVLVKEKTGRTGNYAVPASFQYDVAALTEQARAAYVPDPEEAQEDEDEDACEFCGDTDCEGDCDD